MVGKRTSNGVEILNGRRITAGEIIRVANMVDQRCCQVVDGTGRGNLQTAERLHQQVVHLVGCPRSRNGLIEVAKDDQLLPWCR